MKLLGHPNIFLNTNYNIQVKLGLKYYKLIVMNVLYPKQLIQSILAYIGGGILKGWVASCCEFSSAVYRTKYIVDYILRIVILYQQST